jgi:hypothetical protein
MEKAELLQRMMLRSVLAILLLALSGCALLVPETPAPVPTPQPAPEPQPAPQVEESPVVKPAPAIKAPPVPQPVSARVAVLLSNSLPAYTNVADKLATYLDDYTIYDLADRNRSPRQVFAAIAESEARFVVAIGLGAAKLARTFSTVPVVFSQVFNVTENSLIADSIRGVSVLPPDPNIRNIGAILGDGHEDLIAEADRVMSERGIKFHHAIANSDRETLYHFKRLIRSLDGFILFPDNRILSRDVFTEIMSDAARHHVQVAVFNESLLKHGATFSASAVDSNIADKITIALNQIEDGNIEDVAALIALSEIRIRTNPAMVRVFGLDISGVEIDNSVAEAQ